MLSLLRTKSLAQLTKDTTDEAHGLKRTLRAIDLVAIGVGCIIGVGIFVAPGQEAAVHAGPAIILSFALAAGACALAALCYAEFAGMIPVSGSAYTYSYATLGEIFGWFIGWALVLEYMVGASWVAIGWSAYFADITNHLLRPLGWQLPASLIHAPWDETPGLINLPAALIVLAITGLLIRGIKESAKVNLAIVFVKVAVIVLFVVLAAWYVDTANWKPFMPYGFEGVRTAAAVVFLAYVGFDAVSTAAEEAINPQRDLPRGILWSLLVATVLYIVVSAIMTGVVHYTKLNVPHPIALVLNALNMPWASALIDVGAIAGITSVLLALLLGQPRILFTMSRDGLLPEGLAQVHPRFRTPYLTTLITGVIVAVAAGFTPVRVVAELCSIGTLFSFAVVCAGVIVLRYTRKELNRPFKVPLFPFLPLAGIAMCVYLMIGLPGSTWRNFLVWNLVGLTVYAFYGYRHSKLGPAQEPPPPAPELQP